MVLMLARALIVAGCLLAATPARAAEVTFLGWSAEGVAVARLISPCAQCDVWPDDHLEAADGAGRSIRMELGAKLLTTRLTPAVATRQPTLDGQPVTIETRQVHEPEPKAHHETGGALEVLALRDGKQVASTIVARQSEMEDHPHDVELLGFYPSPDGRRLAVAIKYVSGHGDSRGPDYTLAVLGPGATLPAADAARAEIVEIRHHRPLDQERVLGWTAAGEAVTRASHCIAAGADTLCQTHVAIADDAHATRIWLASVDYDERYVNAPTDRLDEPAALQFIGAEELVMSLLPPLAPSGARVPKLDAVVTPTGDAVSLMSGRKVVVATLAHVDPGELLAAHIRQVIPSPDGQRAVVVFDYHQKNKYFDGWLQTSVVVKL
jgi:hypothetical protein